MSGDELPFFLTVADRCGLRLDGESEEQRRARDEREWSLGEEVLNNRLIRDGILQHLNPYKLSDLQTVLRLREFYGLLPDIDLKECYFEGAWGFRKDEFDLADWREMSVEEMKEKVRAYAHPPGEVDVDTLETKEDIMRAFWVMTYVPRSVFEFAVKGAGVLGLVLDGVTGEDPRDVGYYLQYACAAGLEASVIRGLAEECRELDSINDAYHVNLAAREAARSGHIDVVDLLASEFGARIDWECLVGAAARGHNAMIDHLAEVYGVDPNEPHEVDEDMTALHYAAEEDRILTVQHLVEKYNVDIHARSEGDLYIGSTALDCCGDTTECASYLRELGAINWE